MLKVGGGTPEPGWHIAAPEITVDEVAGTVSAAASLSFVGEGGEDLCCILALYQNGRMLALDTCRASFDLLPDHSVQELTVSCPLPAGAHEGFSAKLFRIDPGSLAPRDETITD